MNPTYDDYDDYEFDDAMHRARRGIRRHPRNEKKSFDRRKLPPRYSRLWADEDWGEYFPNDAYDSMDFDDYDDSTL